ADSTRLPELHSAADRTGKEALGVDARQRGPEVSDAGRQRDERSHVVAVEKIRAAELEVLDVHAESGGGIEGERRLEVRALLAIEQLPLRVHVARDDVEDQTRE